MNFLFLYAFKPEKMKRILSILALAIISLGAVAQEKRMAVVEFSTSYLRLKPDYESPLETQELMGTIVKVTGEKGYWREIVSPQPYQAWVTEKGLVEMSDAELEAYRQAPKVMFTDLYGHVYSWPSVKAETVCDLVGGNIMRVIPEVRDMDSAGRSLKSKARKKDWTQVMLPSGKTGWVQSGSIAKHNGFRSIAKGEGNSESVSEQETEQIIAQAVRLAGVPYLWGGMSASGLDCSGLVRLCYLMHGILLPRNASQQISCGDKVPSGIENLRRGDLVFFGTPATENRKQRVTHVGIYLGNNHIIHASQVVRINSLLPSDADYYENSHRLLGATRL